MEASIAERPISRSIEYRPDIDGLRAIAVLSVVGYHAFPEAIRGGFVGVDVFFVISGYLISTIIFRGLERGDFSYAYFYARRIRRIFPALITVLLACLALGWLIFSGHEYNLLGKHVLAGAGFISNLVSWSEAGYFDEEASTKPLLHLWSLGIEEQFYIVWPLLLGLSFRRKWNFLKLTLLIAAVSFASNIYSINTNPVAAFYSPLSRFWELMLGGILAYLTLHEGRYTDYMRRQQPALGLGLIALSVALLDKQWEFPGWCALFPCAGAALVISAGPQSSLNRRLLSNPLLVRVGLISYPLYLWHWPLLSFARIMAGATPDTHVQTAVILISIYLANGTYNAIEKSTRFGKSITAEAKVLLTLMTGVGCLGFFALQQATLSDLTMIRRYVKEDSNEAKDPDAESLKKYKAILNADPGYLKALEAKRQIAIRAPSCFWDVDHYSFEQVAPEMVRCKALSQSRKNILIIGDSHAADLYAALSDTHKQFNFLEMTGGRCKPAGRPFPQTRQRCAQLMKYALDFTGSHRLDAVILNARWTDAFNDPVTQPDQALISYIDTLKAQGQKVVLMGPGLVYTDEAYNIIERLNRFPDPAAHRIDRRIEKNIIGMSTSMRAFARLKGISYIDRNQYFCENGCHAVGTDGQLFIARGGHIFGPGAAYLGNQLLKSNALQKILDSPVPLLLPEDDHSH